MTGKFEIFNPGIGRHCQEFVSPTESQEFLANPNQKDRPFDEIVEDIDIFHMPGMAVVLTSAFLASS